MTKNRNIISALLITVMVASVFCLPVLTKNEVNAATKKIKITYKANGGAFTAKKYAKKSSYSKKIKKTKKGKKLGKLPTVKRDGYTFKGWYTKKANGKKVTAKTKIKKKTTLYARWSVNSYSFTFDARNGTDPFKQTVKFGGVLPTPKLPGNTLDGWYTALGIKVTPTTLDKIPKESTLYAKWTAGPYGIDSEVLNLLGKSEEELRDIYPDLVIFHSFTYEDNLYEFLSLPSLPDDVYCMQNGTCVGIFRDVDGLFPNTQAGGIPVSAFKSIYGEPTIIKSDAVLPDYKEFKIGNVSLGLSIDAMNPIMPKDRALIYTVPYSLLENIT